MTVFDPDAMVAPLAARAGVLTGPGAAVPPAILVEAVRAGRSATLATGVDDISTGLPARTAQTFEVGSHTKMMTAVVILQLAEEGLLDLDARAADYLPGSLIAGIPNAGTATIRQLLGMRSGVPNYTDGVDVAAWLEGHPGRPFGPAEALDVARGMAATNAPGAAFSYSNTPYLLLGLMIEEVTGRSWATELQHRIFDPLHMTGTTARQFDPDPQRLSSYRLENGRLVDVSDGLWAPRGESGVVSTTSDLITFLSALLVEGRLLSSAALDEMLSFRATGGGNEYGLGIFRIPISGGSVYGFAGGTLGTSSVTWFDPASGIFVSMAASLAGTNSGQAAMLLETTLRGLQSWTTPDGGPVEVRSVAAADLAVVDTPQGACISAHGASLMLDLALRALAADGTSFADGSVLVVGDGTAGTGGDDSANLISIRDDFAAAVDARNHLIGLGGDDRLVGGRAGDSIIAGSGDDRARGAGGTDLLVGGRGSDKLAGGAGSDEIRGGDGHDLLVGRGGADELSGGMGRDVFRFFNRDSRAAAPDKITGFDRAEDTIDLRPVDAIAGQARSAFRWIGADGFSGSAGELRVARAGADLRVEGDTDGDGQADLVILVSDIDGLSAHHFLL